MRNKTIILGLIPVLLCMVFTFVNVTYAQVTIPKPNGASDTILGADPTVGFSNVLAVLTDKLLFLLGIVAILFVIYGGFRYLTAGGNEEAAEAGKKILFNAIIGFVIVLLSWVILVVIQEAIGGNT